jgi:hypothetical protein
MMIHVLTSDRMNAITANAARISSNMNILERMYVRRQSQHFNFHKLRITIPVLKDGSSMVTEDGG